VIDTAAQLATGGYRAVMRISYWDEDGQERWLMFPLAEQNAPDAVLAAIAERLPSLWFDWRVASEVARRTAK
jgi:hypothetical protein